jgi:hypothetical protein
MPRETTIGNANAIAHITQASLGGGNVFTFPANIHEAHIEFIPVGGLTIILPGPDAVPATAVPHSGENPNDGDQYAWKDALNLINNVTPVTVKGGGFKFAVPGTPATQTFDNATILLCTGVEYTFNDVLQLWVPCGCQLTFVGGG